MRREDGAKQKPLCKPGGVERAELGTRSVFRPRLCGPPAEGHQARSFPLRVPDLPRK